MQSNSTATVYFIVYPDVSKKVVQVIHLYVQTSNQCRSEERLEEGMLSCTKGI